MAPDHWTESPPHRSLIAVESGPSSPQQALLQIFHWENSLRRQCESAVTSNTETVTLLCHFRAAGGIIGHMQRRIEEPQVLRRSGITLEEADSLRRENEALRDRLSGLSEASLRISRSLDLDTVLQGVIDERPFADQGPLWRAGGLRRLRGHRDPHHLRHHPRRTPAVRGLAQGPGAPPVPERDRGTAETGGYLQPPQIGRLS